MVPKSPTADSARIGLHVFVVEDHADAADSLAWLLRLDGHRVQVAQEGLSVLRTAQVDPPDVVLLDIALSGMDGWEVARALRAQAGNKTPFLIAVSGYDSAEDCRRSEEAGIHLHLAKPVDPDLLCQVLRRLQGIIRPDECIGGGCRIRNKRARRRCAAFV